MTLNDMAEDIKYLCTYTIDGEHNSYQEWLEYNNGDDEGYGHIYELAERIQDWINKEVPF